MSTPQPNYVAQWERNWSPSSSPSKVGGLIDQLLEAGRVVKEFNMPDATYQVATNFHFEVGSCFFRCAVLRDGVELGTGAWAPVFRNANELVAGKEGDPEAKLQVARQALEAHLGLCSRVGRRLEEKGTLTEPAHRILFTVAVVLIVLAGLAAWFGIERYRTYVEGEIRATLGPWQAPVIETVIASDSDPAKEEAEEVPIAEPEQVSRASPASPPPQPEAETIQPNREVTERKRATPPPRVEQPAPKPQPEPREEQPKIAAEVLSPPPPVAPVPVVTGVRPLDHRSITLSVGEEIFENLRTRVSMVPQILQDIPCFTTHSYDGGGVTHFSFDIAVPVHVFVAHDRRVKKKPDWLDSFQATGVTLTCSDAESSAVVFDIFRRDLESGRLTLGANTQTKAVTRKFREFVPKRQAMYLVCFSPRT